MTNSHDDHKAPDATGDHSVSHGMIEDVRDRLEAGWDTLKSNVRAKFHKLTVEDLELTEIKGKLDELVHRIATRYGYDDTRAREELSRFLSPSDKQDDKPEEKPEEKAEAPKSDEPAVEATPERSKEPRKPAVKKPAGRRPAVKAKAPGAKASKPRRKAA